VPAGTGITYNAVTPEIKIPPGGNVLYVFALPDARR
jgi:hypothetical protein